MLVDLDGDIAVAEAEIHAGVVRHCNGRRVGAGVQRERRRHRPPPHGCTSVLVLRVVGGGRCAASRLSPSPNRLLPLRASRRAPRPSFPVQSWRWTAGRRRGARIVKVGEELLVVHHGHVGGVGGARGRRGGAGAEGAERGGGGDGVEEQAVGRSVRVSEGVGPQVVRRGWREKGAGMEVMTTRAKRRD